MYSSVEQSVIEEIASHFSELDTSRVSTSLDEVLTNMFQSNSRYGVLVEFNGAKKDTREPFKRMVWTYNIDCIFFIMLSDSMEMVEIEGDLRNILDKVLTLFSENQRLGNTVAKVELIDVGRAEPSKVNDNPFYVLPFIIEVILPPS